MSPLVMTLWTKVASEPKCWLIVKVLQNVISFALLPFTLYPRNFTVFSMVVGNVLPMTMPSTCKNVTRFDIDFVTRVHLADLIIISMVVSNLSDVFTAIPALHQLID